VVTSPEQREPARPSPTLTVVVPAYNEEHALASFLPELLACCEKNAWRLIVVDDGSTDRTPAILERLAARPGCRVLRHKLNRGYGGAIKTGIRAVDTDYVITLDADGQHYLDDAERLFAELQRQEADMVVGSRRGQRSASRYRSLGKRVLRLLAGFLLDLHVHDINSGMKAYDAGLARRYLGLCPDSMAFSDVITLVFVSQRHRVHEHPIRIRERVGGRSTISTRTALETLMEILNIVVLFNPLRIFLPISAVSLVLGFAWGLPIVLRGNGVSVGAMLAIVTGVIFFLLGLLAEQISMIRRGDS
jgi:glycosyltransferase involved in cell wall biosynthesis